MNAAPFELLGEAASLGAAMLWALSVAIFRPAIQAYGARTVNLLKCALAAVLLAVTVPVLGHTHLLTEAPASDLAWLAASGVVGLSLGDTALFAAVTRIGTHRALLMQTFAPVFTAVLAFVFLDERLTALELTGAAVVLAGVALVVAPGWRRRPGGGKADVGSTAAAPMAGAAAPMADPAAPMAGAADATLPEPTAAPSPDGPLTAAVTPAGGALAVGLLLGVLGAFGQGAGIVLAKEGMDVITPVPAAFLRLSMGAVGLMAVGLVTGNLFSAVRALRDRRARRSVLPATFLGTYLAMMLMMTGIALAPASIAAVLLAMPPVFSLAVEGIAGRERITVPKVAGTLLAVAGVAILVWR